MKAGREFLKSRWETLSDIETDQKKGLPQPPVEKVPADCLQIIDLVPADKLTLGTMPLLEVINKRRSRRHFTDDALTLEELSFLLWTTQGVREVAGTRTMRTVPSAGARHPFETYLSVHRVTGLTPGLYRYLPTRHKLCLLVRARPHAGGVRGVVRAEVRERIGRDVRLDGRPLPDRVALRTRVAQGHRLRRGPRLPESLPGGRVHRLRAPWPSAPTANRRWTRSSAWTAWTSSWCTSRQWGEWGRNTPTQIAATVAGMRCLSFPEVAAICSAS